MHLEKNLIFSQVIALRIYLEGKVKHLARQCSRAIKELTKILKVQ